MSALASFLNGFRQLVDSALSKAADVIQRIQRGVFQALSRIAGLIVSTLQRILRSTVLPMIDRVERSILQALGKGQQQTVDALRANRRQHLQALSLVTGAAKPAVQTDAGAEPRKTGSADDGLSRIRDIGQEAIRNNRTIVQSFEERTSSTFGSIVQAVLGAGGQIVQQITGAVSQALQLVAAKVAEVLAKLVEVAGAVTSFVQSLLQALSSAVAGVVDYVRSLVQGPVDQLLGFARSAFSRVRDFVSGLVRSMIDGIAGFPSLVSAFVLSGGPITKPRPPGGPITLPGLREILLIFAIAGAIVLYFFPGLAAAVIGALVSLGLSPMGALRSYSACSPSWRYSCFCCCSTSSSAGC